MSPASQGADDEGLLEILRPGIEAWNTGDLDAAIELIDPDIVWHSAQVFLDADEAIAAAGLE